MTDCTAFFERWGAALQQAALYLPRPNPTFRNLPFDRAGFRVLIVRLSPFRDVDCSTPHLFLFQAVRRALPGAYIDMAFFPPRHDRGRLERAGVPPLVGIQSLRSVEDFDLVLISNAYTLELVNLPYLLLRSGLPLMASQRDDRWPPLILGGSNGMAAQAVVAEDGDSLVDGIFFGEGEGRVGPLVRYLYEHRHVGKRERLAGAAARIRGLWATGGWPERPVEVAILPAPGMDHLLVDYPILNGEEAGTARLQINYGCPAFCSFCFEGYDRKPYREVALSDILEAARRVKGSHGCETLELYSFNFNTHSEVLALILELNRLFERVGFKSQRVDILYATPGLLEAEVVAGKRSFTLGIEGISDRLRTWLHKSLEGGEIVGLLEALLRRRVREVKLFFILTGYEEEADLVQFRRLVRGLKGMRQRLDASTRVIFSFGRLIRMPFTPLRYDRLLLDPADWRGIVGPVKSICETNGFEFRMATPWEEYCTSQVLAMGGYGLHEVLIELARKGYCYDGRLSPGYWEELRGWLEAHGRWTPAFLGEKGPDYPFPFQFVRPSVRPSFLYRQYRRAKAGMDEGYCLGGEGGAARCLGCGACVEEGQREAIAGHRIRPPEGGYPSRLRSVMERKQRLRPVYARLWVPPLVAGTTPQWMNGWVFRALLEGCPEQVDNLLSVRESLFTTRENHRRFPGFHGETVFALRVWEPDGLIQALMGLEGGAPDRLTFLSLAEGFEPGRFRRAILTLTLPAGHFPEAGRQLVAYLRSVYVPCNVRREGEGYRLDLPARARKKRVVFEGSYEERADEFIARLVIGPKFDLAGFLRSFAGADQHRPTQVEFSDVVVR